MNSCPDTKLPAGDGRSSAFIFSCLTMHSCPERITLVRNYAPTGLARFFCPPVRTRLGLRSRTGLKTGPYTELTEKNQSSELRGFCVLRASVANSVFLSSLDGACHASRLRASGRPFGKLRVNGRYKDHKRKHSAPRAAKAALILRRLRHDPSRLRVN